MTLPPPRPKEFFRYTDPIGFTYICILAVRPANSKWFLKAFIGGFKEASQNTIELHDDDPQNFEYMLRFLYTTEMAIPSLTKNANSKQKIQRKILIPIGVFILADKYEIGRLLRHTKSQVESGMRNYSNLFEDDVTIPIIVAAYYSNCARAESGTGAVIARGMIDHATRWLRFGNLDTLKGIVIHSGHFAADLIIAIRSAEKTWQ